MEQGEVSAGVPVRYRVVAVVSSKYPHRGRSTTNWEKGGKKGALSQVSAMNDAAFRWHTFLS